MNIIINGVNGKLGRSVADCASGKAVVVAGVDINADDCPHSDGGFRVYKMLSQIREIADVIIDCSFHGAIYDLLDYANSVRLPAIIATTGHTAEEKNFIAEASKRQPIFLSANMSIGVNVLLELSKTAARVLHETFDIEIVEAHHNGKIDAPSGTALMIADAVSEQLAGTYDYVYDRTGVKTARKKDEIGIHSIRGGSIVGEHDVIFAGPSEVITLRHQALSRAVFAEGALAAARFMVDKPIGFYDMSRLLERVL